MTDIIKQTRLSIIMVLLAAVTWLIMLPILPDFIGMQFTSAGEVVWGTNKYLAAFIFTGLMVFVYVLSVIKPAIDPKKSSYPVFRKHFSTGILVAEILIYLVGCFLMLNAMDIGFNLIQMVMVIVGFTFIFTGNYLPKVPTAWLVGIRNPWSLTDKDIWNRTHRFTGILYIAVGFLCILFSFLNLINTVVILILIGICIIIPHLYSFILFRFK